MVTMHVILSTGTATQMAGEFAERCTATELRRARRRGWRIVNAVKLRRATGDLDHIILGRGGLIAIETKWIGAPSGADWVVRARVNKAVKQVSDTAAWLYAMFPNDVGAEARQNVVVLWGTGADGWGAPTEIDNVIVLQGRDLRAWLDARPTTLVTDTAIERVWKILIDTVDRRDANALETKRPGPMPIGGHIARLFGFAVATMLVMLLLAFLVTAV